MHHIVLRQKNLQIVIYHVPLNFDQKQDAQYMMELITGYFISLNFILNVFRTPALNRVTMKGTCTLRQSGQCPGCSCIISVVFLEKRTKIISKRTSMIRGFYNHKTILYLLCCNIITQYGSTVYIGIAMLYPH